MSEERIDPGHKNIRNILRIVGPMTAMVGLIFIVVGLIGFFRAFGSFGPPKYAWCPFVGMPLLFVGLVLSFCGYMGKVMRYQAGEVAPVAKDTFNYMADGTSDGVKTMASALGQGLREGGFGAGSAAKTQVRCHKCNGLNDVEAKFCDQCGQAMGKSRPCPDCSEMNDPDAKFCDNCGHRYK
jgi:hypothetical protein